MILFLVGGVQSVLDWPYSSKESDFDRPKNESSWYDNAHPPPTHFLFLYTQTYLLQRLHLKHVFAPQTSHFNMLVVLFVLAKCFLMYPRSPHSRGILSRVASLASLKFSTVAPSPLIYDGADMTDVSLCRFGRLVHSLKYSSPGRLLSFGVYLSIYSERARRKLLKLILDFSLMHQLLSRLPSQHSVYISYAAMIAIARACR